MSFNVRDAVRLYGIENWGAGYFEVNEAGHLVVRPNRDDRSVDLHALVGRLRKKKVRFPALLRFPQILADRVHELFDAFDKAITEYAYANRYLGVFPVKVNQKREVVDELVEAGRDRGMGLEAGSKAELAIALSHRLNPDALIICNGYKDAAYVRLALRGVELGKRVVLIVEKPQEVGLILRVSKQVGVAPLIGMRIRLHARGSGKWEKSGGQAAKFGLTTQEVLEAVEELKRADALSSFRLLHFHVGSQIPEIKRIKAAVKEGARVYAKLRAAGAPLEVLDVGGGLGVDYDGSKTSYEASMNYTLQEYANDVVYIVREICGAEGVPEPSIASESGRALVAFHSLLICEVRGANATPPDPAHLMVPQDVHDVLREMKEILDGMTRKNHREYYHDAMVKREELYGLFDLGYLSLRERALGERLYEAIARQAVHFAKEDRFVPEEFEDLEKRLVTKYIANFSVFQSIPDSWALDQLFPVVPIHRLGEEPTVQATLCDVTCDSDGEVDRFVDLRDVKDSLDLHELDGRPYYVAILMVGAYQDVLGDYHNLFGIVDEA
ncbi:MAG TPA: biosynthetic arginine decarboxylase, partial [Planctomycetota bacterium]|nr:biosynthetic arginine decarboxylase [Planctomycetota bacterium]